MKKLNFTINNVLLMGIEEIYNEDFYEMFNIPNYHLYAVLSLPKCYMEDIYQDGCKIEILIKNETNLEKYEFSIEKLNEFDDLKLNFTANEAKTKVRISSNCYFKVEERILDEIVIDMNDIYLTHADELNFTIEYIGQSFGKNGKRNAFKRDQNHSTIQKIVIENDSLFKPKSLYVLMMNSEYIEINNEINTSYGTIKSKNLVNFTNATNQCEGKYLNLLEAFLINYFKPKYNSDFVRGIVPCNKHTSYSKIFEENYSDFSFNAYYEPTCKNVTLCTNTQKIFLEKGWLTELINVSFENASLIEPEKYYYSFIDYKTEEDT